MVIYINKCDNASLQELTQNHSYFINIVHVAVEK